VADRAYVMVHGRIEFEGKSAAEFQDNPMIKRYLGTQERRGTHRHFDTRLSPEMPSPGPRWLRA
jgi:hypothetical protein